jgi:hypothetical protein
MIREKKDDDDDQDYADQTVPTMAVAVARAAEAPTETAKEEDHEDDYKDESERHDRLIGRAASLQCASEHLVPQYTLQPAYYSPSNTLPFGR